MPTDPHEHDRTQAQVANDAPTSENVHGVGAQQQGAKPQTPPAPSTEGHHGGNHGNDLDDEGAPDYVAKGSSHEGTHLDAQNLNSSGGGSLQEHKNQTKNTTTSGTDYHDGNAAPSPANDGGKIGDADNPV